MNQTPSKEALNLLLKIIQDNLNNLNNSELFNLIEIDKTFINSLDPYKISNSKFANNPIELIYDLTNELKIKNSFSLEDKIIKEKDYKLTGYSKSFELLKNKFLLYFQEDKINIVINSYFKERKYAKENSSNLNFFKNNYNGIFDILNIVKTIYEVKTFKTNYVEYYKDIWFNELCKKDDSLLYSYNELIRNVKYASIKTKIESNENKEFTYETFSTYCFKEEPLMLKIENFLNSKDKKNNQEIANFIIDLLKDIKDINPFVDEFRVLKSTIESTIKNKENFNADNILIIFIQEVDLLNHDKYIYNCYYEPIKEELNFDDKVMEYDF